MPTESVAPLLPKNFLRPCLLLLLREHPAHGYELIERLRLFGFDGSDPGGLYRALRALEDAGLVRSSWERSGQGPDRRIYEITRAGAEVLHARVQALSATTKILETLLSRYEEFVTLGRSSRRGQIAERR